MISIAIDGPAGAGKSTIAKKLSKKLGYLYVDTGALYRAIGLYMVRNGVDLKDENAVIKKLPAIAIDLKYIDGIQHIFLNGEDVSEQIRENEISKVASEVSKIQQVRTFLLDLQRDLAKENNVIMDGRDIGTVVLPDADIKIFLTASVHKRAMRRHWQLKKKGIEVSVKQLICEINERDKQDSSRAAAPLKQAQDAILFDNSDLNLNQSLKQLMAIIQEEIG